VHLVDIIWRILKIGKRKVLTESHLKELILPQLGDLLDQVIKPIGADIIVKCTDGKIRICRKGGKLSQSMRIRNNKLVLGAPLNFQSDIDDNIIRRYIAAHADKLEQDDGYLADLRQLNNKVISR
jgi:translation initiation factor 1A